MTLAAQRAGDATPEHPDPPPRPLAPLAQALVSADAVTTARSLLGALLVRDDHRGRLIGRIVETEAYAGPGDQASHARTGRTPRTAVMFGPPGIAYVYLVYGLHHCLNVVCGADGVASAVLLRALEPVAGLEGMRERRGPTAGDDERLAAGPGRLCQALDIDRTFSGHPLLTPGPLWLAAAPAPVAEVDVVQGPRIGVDYAGPDWASRPWRFGVAGSPALSRPFPGAD
ncbi:MAG: DNA-3-methyladenine glycosylase [Candidatus Limnocylindrales bacterium]